MQINYEDERFQDVKAEEKEALTEVQQTYDGMIDKAGTFYEGQINEIDKWTQKQQGIQQEQTDFAVEQLQQQKDQTKKDYIKEQSGAYTDWKKQSSQHGANAEQMAGAGLAGSGYSESSQVAMYTAYQGRVAAARESFTQAALTYDNAMKEARLQGSAAMAEIALQGFQQQLELTLQGFQYENQLIQQLLAQKQQVQDRYYGRWQDVLAQLNQEAALNEEIRQFNEQMGIKTGSGTGNSSSGNNQESAGQPALDVREQEQPVLEEPTVTAPLGNKAESTGKNEMVFLDAGTRGAKPSEVQPNSISGHGKLVDTAETVDVDIMLNGQKKTVEMTVRRAEDGTLWGWDPQQESYFQVGVDKSWRRNGR